MLRSQAIRVDHFAKANSSPLLLPRCPQIELSYYVPYIARRKHTFLLQLNYPNWGENGIHIFFSVYHIFKWILLICMTIFLYIYVYTFRAGRLYSCFARHKLPWRQPCFRRRCWRRWLWRLSRDSHLFISDAAIEKPTKHNRPRYMCLHCRALYSR